MTDRNSLTFIIPGLHEGLQPPRCLLEGQHSRIQVRHTSNPVKKKFFTVMVMRPWRPREVVNDPSVEVSKVTLCWDFEKPGLVEGASAKGSWVGTR